MASLHWRPSPSGIHSVRDAAHVAAQVIRPPTLALLLVLMLGITGLTAGYVAEEAPPIVARQGQSIADALNALGEGGSPAAMKYRRPAVAFEHMYDARVKPMSVDHMYGRAR
jgi:hypothetical protein